MTLSLEQPVAFARARVTTSATHRPTVSVLIVTFSSRLFALKPSVLSMGYV
jgi:hypothetical protein